MGGVPVLATGKGIKDDIGSRGNLGLLKAGQVTLEMPGGNGWFAHDAHDDLRHDLGI